MLRLQHSPLTASLPTLGLTIVLALLCISSFTAASPVQSSKDVLLAGRAPIPGTVNSRPGQPGSIGLPESPPTSPVSVGSGQDSGPIPICTGEAPTDTSLYPTIPLANRFIGGSLEDVCRERDPGPNCICIPNPRTLQVELQCVTVGRFFPTLDRDWHLSGIMQVCRQKCICPHVPAEQIPPSSPRSPLGPRPPSMGQRPSRTSQDLDHIV